MSSRSRQDIHGQSHMRYIRPAAAMQRAPMVGTTDYDSIARRYAAKIDERPWNAPYERPATLALLPDVNGKDVLDAGCGHGWYADWLARKGHHQGAGVAAALRDLGRGLGPQGVDAVEKVAKKKL
jgi:2-polyprenyl-3-methyl-5-hydroxy-6-metoxy-1,4-benzoquinol methylase